MWNHGHSKLLLRALVVLTFIVTLSIGITSQALASPDISAFTINYGLTGHSNDDLNYVASKYKLVVTHDLNNQAKITYLHQQNPSLTILAYLNGNVVVKDSADWNYITANHPEWFLLDSLGNKVYEKDWTDNFLMNPTNNAWRDYRAAQLSQLVNNGYDGIFLDVMCAWIKDSANYIYYSAHPINPATGQPFTNPEWWQANYDFLNYMKQTIGPGKLLIFNGIGTGKSYYDYNYRPYLDVADGALIEGFTRWGGNAIGLYKSEADWAKDVDALAEISSLGKVSLAMTDIWSAVVATDTEVAAVQMYSLSSYLLGQQGQAYYDSRRFTWATPCQPYNDLWSTSIGTPSGAYYKQDNVYQRDFSNGKVLVNPNAVNSYSVNLAAQYKMLDGQVVSQVTLAPHAGVILLNNPVPAGGGSSGGGSSGGSGGGTAPEGSTSISINNGNVYTTKQNVTITLTTGLVPTAMVLSNDGLNWSAPQSFASTTQWTLSPADGAKTVFVKLQTAPESWSEPISAQIVLDSTPPKVSVTDSALSASSMSANQSGFSFKNIWVQATDENGIDKVEFYLNDKLMATDTETPYTYRCSYPQGSKSSYVLKARAYDKAANTATAFKYLTSQTTYKDVLQASWAQSYIDKLSLQGVIDGFADGTFRPYENVTRAQFAKMMCLAMGWKVELQTESSFTDVTSGYWASSYIETAKTHGVISGYRDGQFRPNRNITRAEIAKIIATTKGYTMQSANEFTDISSCWAESYILSCANCNIISGYPDGAFKPQKNATRAEAAKILASILAGD